MNILYINHYAGSLQMGMEFRPYYLSREWKRMGHNVRIVGASFSHLRKVNPKVVKDFEVQVVDGIEYQWVKTKEYEGNGVDRAITMAQFVCKIYWHAYSIVKQFKPDIVIASSTYPLDTFAAKHIANLAKCKYIHEVHDMWPITPMELYGMSKWHPFVVAMQLGENYFCKKADTIVSVLPYAKEYFCKHGMKEDKFVYVPNGIDLDDWKKPEELPYEYKETLNKAKSENKKIIGFFGSHTKSYSLDYLLEALSKIDQEKVFVAFVGSGNYKEKLMEYAKWLNIDSNAYAFFDPISKMAIPSFIDYCDITYIGAIKNKMFRFGIGMNKLFDAMMGGKPLLYAVDAPNNFAVEYDCGISVEAENTDALVLGIETFLAMDEDTLKAMGENAKSAIISRYNYSVLAKTFADTFVVDKGEENVV